MELKLTNEEYEKLVKLVYMGMWIAESTEKASEIFGPLEQLIYSQSTQIPDQKLIEYDAVDQNYYPAAQFDNDDTVMDAIEAYEETCFWDELIDRFTKRDMIRTYGLDKIHHMTQDEIFEKEKEFIEKYEKIFQEFGLDKLETA